MAVKKNKTDDKNIQQNKTCIICSSELKAISFYNCRSEIIDDRFSICKNCACRIANNSMEDMHKILRLLDVPFIPDIVKETEGNDNPFSRYMLLINNPKKKFDDSRTYSELRYCDSPTLKEITNVNEYIYKSDEQLSALKDIFGDWWKKDQLLSMDRKLEKMFLQYGGNKEDMPKMDLYCEIIRLELMSMERYAKGDTKEGKALSDARQKLLKDNGMNVQAMKDKKNNDSIGEKIDWVEFEPILPSKKYYDIDGIMYMWQKLIDQLCRFRGFNKTPVDDDAKDMIDYVEKNGNFYEEME